MNRGHSEKQWLRRGWLIGLVLLLGVITLVVGRADEQEFINLLRRSAPQWLLVAAVLQACTYVCAAKAWTLSLAHMGYHHPLRRLIPLGLAKLFTDQAVPSAGISGTLLLVHSFQKRQIPREAAMGTVFVGLVAYYAAYVLCVGVALLVLWWHGDLNQALLTLASALALLALSVPLVILWLRSHPGIASQRYFRRLPLVKDFLQTLEDVPLGVLKAPILMVWLIAIQVAVFLLDAATLWVMLRAVGTVLSFEQIFACFIMASLVATLLIMPGGIGTFEGTAVAMLHLFGVPLEAGLAATLLLRGFTFWLPMLPGLWLARREMAS